MELRIDSLTKKFLLCGAIAGPLFIVVVIIQDFAIPGFNPMVHLLSQLSLGKFGFIQITNFILDGIQNILYSIGIWKALYSKKGKFSITVFIITYGLFLILVGIFRTDPAHGFPPGYLTPAHPSTSGIIHALGALFTFISLICGIISFSRFFFLNNMKILGFYFLASAILVLLVFIGGMAYPSFMGPALQIAVIVGWSAPSIAAMKLLKG